MIVNGRLAFRVAVVAVAGLVFAACSSSGGGGSGNSAAPGGSSVPGATGGSSSGPGAPGMSKVTVYSVQDPQIAAQLAIAESKGMFAKYGVDVDAHYFPTGSAVAPGFVSGSVQIGMASSLAMVTVIASGFDAKLIGAVSEVSGGMGIVMKKSLGYDPKNLAGKRLGIIDAPPTRVLLANFAQKSPQYGLDFSSVKLVNFQDPATMLTAFSNGGLDAVAIWNPTFLQATQYGNILFSGSKSYIPDGKPKDWNLFAVPICIYTTSGFAQKNPNTIVAVLKGLNDATKYIAAHPDELTAQLVALLHTPQDLTAKMVAQNEYSMKVDQSLVDRLRTQTKYLYDNKLLKKDPDPSSYLDLTFLKQVDPSLATGH